MIKRYNQFIETKTNEEFVFDKVPTFGGTFGGSETAPTKPEVAPGTTEKPGTAQPLPEEPVAPNPIRRERTSPVPAPAKAELEEEGSDIYTSKIQELADLLGVEAENGQVIYNGKKIIFPSETEKYQIEGVKKGFNTPEEVVAELEKTHTHSTIDTRVEETEEELDSLADDEASDEIEREFESKSYKSRYNRK